LCIIPGGYIYFIIMITVINTVRISF